MFSPEIVRLTKHGGPLTKRIYLDETDAPKSDGSACVMSRGLAYRAPISCVGQLGAMIGSLQSDQAIALGTLRHGLSREIKIAAKRTIIGRTSTETIARTGENIVFRAGSYGFALLDYDTKGMPPGVAERLHQEGGFWPALVSIMPELASIARVSRASTSAGLYRQDTGAPVPGSNGLHLYLAVRDTTDSTRFLKTLHERCWLAGLGWMMVGGGGQLLERSIVDRMVGAPERLVFEGAPILIEPLAQDAEARRPNITEGEWLDTKASCSPLTILEKARFAELRRKAAHQLTGECAKAREEFIDHQADHLAKRSGMSRHAAKEVIVKQCKGVLLPAVVLPFDDPELEGKTVADVLAHPAAFEGETLADPLEGVDYGRCKARIMRRADGTPWINSFAHGRATYELKLDATAIRAAMTKADANDVVIVLVDLLMEAAIAPSDEESLIAYAKERSGVGMRAIQRQLKKARAVHTGEKRKQERERHLAERDDPRPMLPVPVLDSPFLPVMDTANSVIGACKDPIPPPRDITRDAVSVRRHDIAGAHAFTTANQEL